MADASAAVQSPPGARRPSRQAPGARRRLLVELAERQALGFPLGITLGLASQRAAGRVVGDHLRRPQNAVVAVAGGRRRSPSWMLSGHGALPIGRRSELAAAPARKVDDRPSARPRRAGRQLIARIVRQPVSLPEAGDPGAAAR